MPTNTAGPGDLQAHLDHMIEERRASARAHLPGHWDFPVGRAERCHVFDETGRPYLDFGPGGAINILGHHNEQVTHALWNHLHQYSYTGQHAGRYQVAYAEALAATFPQPDRQVLVLSSVSEARRIAREMPGRIHDESGTGFGRTGRMWGSDPDDDAVVLLGPAGGGGLPFAALVASAEQFDGISPPPMAAHPLACTAGTAVLSQLTPELLQHVAAMGTVLADGLAEVAEQFPAVIRSVAGPPDGVGLLQKITTVDLEDTQRLFEACRDRGLLLHHTLYLTPPLVITEQEVKQAVDILADVCLDWS
ncbi:aminotransferase [Mycobacterium phage Phrappuccino]|uniref:Aminotransferase n=1 Tax=Mycobacterium phage Phrappuccino TaxID=2591223 RepID=A0A514DDT9_9CAUD|nr:aminotransferase [Mycobacterium phage Phrappuccino]QDH91781.1 aminotransferase [Mycobacterium phage Phrappuccino]QIQ63223.1 aminotransferase [Mycobacterium phage Settecandela]